MKVLLVFAHPERHSLNGALRDVAVAELQEKGHEVRVSDLYADGWKAIVDRSDFPDAAPGERLRVAGASGRAFAAGALTEDVKAEQEKLLWADILILQFPLWWYSMPPSLREGWTAYMPSGSRTGSASGATRIGATGLAKAPWPASARC